MHDEPWKTGKLELVSQDVQLEAERVGGEDRGQVFGEPHEQPVDEDREGVFVPLQLEPQPLVGGDGQVDRAARAAQLTAVALEEERLALQVAEREQVVGRVGVVAEGVLAHVDQLGRDQVLDRAAGRELGEAALGVVAAVGELGVGLLLFRRRDPVRVDLGEGRGARGDPAPGQALGGLLEGAAGAASATQL